MNNHHLSLPNLLPEGAAGIDAGMTMTKTVRHTPNGIEVSATETTTTIETNAWARLRYDARTIGITGARLGDLAQQEGVVAIPEIDAAARGCLALLTADDALGDGEFLMALLGTGTAFAAIRDGKATHLGGAALGGGSFAALARRTAPNLTYTDAIAAAERGDRRNVDIMISDVYPEGIGRISADLTAAHLARDVHRNLGAAGEDLGAVGGELEAVGGDPAAAGQAPAGQASAGYARAEHGNLDDFLAGLLNLHGESIAQIAAGRARMANLTRIVLCGGFIHNNPSLQTSITQMAALFGCNVEVVPAPAYVGAIGAALTAAEA